MCLLVELCSRNRLKVVKTRRSLQWLIGGRRREMSTTGALILRLSDDLVLHVFSFLRAEMLARVRALNRRMCAIASGGRPLLWGVHLGPFIFQPSTKQSTRGARGQGERSSTPDCGRARANVPRGAGTRGA